MIIPRDIKNIIKQYSNVSFYPDIKNNFLVIDGVKVDDDCIFKNYICIKNTNCFDKVMYAKNILFSSNKRNKMYILRNSWYADEINISSKYRNVLYIDSMPKGKIMVENFNILFNKNIDEDSIMEHTYENCILSIEL